MYWNHKPTLKTLEELHNRCCTYEHLLNLLRLWKNIRKKICVLDTVQILKKFHFHLAEQLTGYDTALNIIAVL